MSISEKEKQCQDMLYNRIALDEDWLIQEVFSNHPNWEEKSYPGIKQISIGTSPDWHSQCFYLHRIDGTSTDIGFKKSLRPPNNKQKIAKACRTAVQESINKFKASINYGRDRCPITKNILYEHNSHIDHYEPQFVEIVSMWLTELKFTSEDIDEIANKFVNKSIDNNSTTRFTNDELANDFKNYHDKIAQLRCIEKTENLKRTKYKLLTKD